MKWPEEYINQIICGDCLEVMKGMPDNSIDTIITDPPYGLKFMGKKWDYQVPSIEVWQECLRVLKPGGTALIFAGSRTQHRMAVNVEDAGFILKDCIMYLYGSGFPKASDISKNLDKMAGEEREVIGERCMHYSDTENWSNKSNAYTDNSNAIVKIAPGTYGKNFTRPITAPATLEAALWNGWKSHGLKPAYEPILVAMKPNEGSYANNALKWGVSGLNIDGGRVETTPNDPNRRTAKPLTYGKPNDTFLGALSSRRGDFNPQGRYPANIILDEEAGRLLDEQTSHLHASGDYPRKTEPSKGMFLPGGVKGATNNGYFDTGGASRFFYCAKASKAERNRGCEGLEEKQSKTMNERNADVSGNSHNTTGQKPALSKNHHPTVKPLSLMKYLCTLTKTPTGGIVLDPFCGSGTTLMACKELRRDYIGIDNNAEYCEIARRRVNTIAEPLF